VVKTAGGGIHVYYRCPGHVAGNTKLAKVAEPVLKGGTLVSTMIETRGTGGQVVAPGGPISVHKSRRTYSTIRGSLLDIPTVSPDEREIMLTAARELSEVDLEAEVEDTGERTLRVRSAYEAHYTWPMIFEGTGWTAVGKRGDRVLWARPGSDTPSGNTLGDCFYVFSGNAPPFKPNTAYGKLKTIALLQCHGDVERASAALVDFAAIDPATELRANELIGQ
jgi:hypothetical protein